jgi:ornithine cyclodeaminase/alanine dehydrogenase-like protein (mu-crystallin family)
MGQLLIIGARLVHELLPMQQCIALMEHALTLVTHETTQQPLRSWMRAGELEGLLATMPGYIASPPTLGIKVLTVFAGNPDLGRGSHQGMVLLFDCHDGRPLAMVDAGAVTAVRTAAVTAVATRVLADPAARTLGLFGYGEQAHTHLESLTQVHRFERVLLWGRNAERREAFARTQSARLGIDIEPLADPRAVADADVLCTLTAAREPFLCGAWLRPGQHVNLVGSSLPSTAEADSDAVARARYFVDYRDSALVFAGEFRRARAEGRIEESHLLGSVGEVLVGAIPGRRGPEDITLFKSLGMAAEDLVACAHVLAEAERRGLGERVDW